jgi:hypothetical protein
VVSYISRTIRLVSATTLHLHSQTLRNSPITLLHISPSTLYITPKVPTHITHPSHHKTTMSDQNNQQKGFFGTAASGLGTSSPSSLRLLLLASSLVLYGICANKYKETPSAPLQTPWDRASRVSLTRRAMSSRLVGKGWVMR